MYLAIDPGLDTAWALFTDAAHMIGCGLGNPRPVEIKSYVRAAETGDHGLPDVHVALIERPKIYQARNMKGNPNDIITLAINVGQYKEAWESIGVRVVLATPHEWKGSQSKEINNNLTLESLSLAERAIVRKAAQYVPKSKQHNILDAIGMGRAAFYKRLW